MNQHYYFHPPSLHQRGQGHTARNHHQQHPRHQSVTRDAIHQTITSGTHIVATAGATYTTLTDDITCSITCNTLTIGIISDADHLRRTLSELTGPASATAHRDPSREQRQPMPANKPLNAHTGTHTRTTHNALNIINTGDPVDRNIVRNALTDGINSSTLVYCITVHHSDISVHHYITVLYCITGGLSVGFSTPWWSLTWPSSASHTLPSPGEGFASQRVGNRVPVPDPIAPGFSQTQGPHRSPHRLRPWLLRQPRRFRTRPPRCQGSGHLPRFRPRLPCRRCGVSPCRQGGRLAGGAWGGCGGIRPPIVESMLQVGC